MSDIEFPNEGDDESEYSERGIPDDLFEQVLEAFHSQGYDVTDDILVGFAALENADDVRGLVFPDAIQALEFLREIGVQDFSEIVWLEEDMWGVAIHDSP